MKVLLIPLLFSTIVSHASTIGAHSGTLVTTQEGVVAGSLVSPTVRRFLGIPFASAGRWEAPVKPARRSSVLKADKFSDTCLQLKTPANLEFLKLAGGQGIDIPESENCLTVNIWAPSTPRKQKTAVLLWIYGGAFQFGSVSNLVLVYDSKYGNLFACYRAISPSMVAKILSATTTISLLSHSTTVSTSLASPMLPS